MSFTDKKALIFNHLEICCTPEITARISQVANIRIFEVGVSYYGRTFEEGKKQDGEMALE